MPYEDFIRSSSFFNVVRYALIFWARFILHLSAEISGLVESCWHKMRHLQATMNSLYNSL